MTMLSLRYGVTVLAVLLSACAYTYRPPTTPPQTFTAPLTGKRSDIFDAAKRALVLDGYAIQESDRDAGTISTTARPQRLTADDCDCGTTLGLPYIKDNRTSTTVAMGVIVGDGQVTITPSIHGSYLPANVNQSISFDCVSKGTLERALLDKIRGSIAPVTTAQ